jgi:hypothetical protein
VGSRGVGTARETGWVTDRDGLRLFDLKSAAIKISEVIRDRIDNFNKELLEDSHTSHSKRDNGLMWFTKDSDGVYSDIYYYQYMIDEIRQGWYSQIVPNPSTFDVQHVWEIEDSNGDYKLRCGTKDGMVFNLLDPEALNWVDSAGQSRAITMKVQTPYMRLGTLPEAAQMEGTTGRVTIRYVELRIKEESGLDHEWTVTVDTSNSAAEDVTPVDTQDMTFTFPAGSSLIRKSLKDLTPAEYVRFTITNDQKDRDLSIMGVKVYFHVRPGQYPVEGNTPGQN